MVGCRDAPRRQRRRQRRLWWSWAAVKWVLGSERRCILHRFQSTLLSPATVVITVAFQFTLQLSSYDEDEADEEMAIEFLANTPRDVRHGMIRSAVQALAPLRDKMVPDVRGRDPSVTLWMMGLSSDVTAMLQGVCVCVCVCTRVRVCLCLIEPWNLDQNMIRAVGTLRVFVQDE